MEHALAGPRHHAVCPQAGLPQLICIVGAWLSSPPQTCLRWDIKVFGHPPVIVASCRKKVRAASRSARSGTDVGRDVGEAHTLATSPRRTYARAHDQTTNIRARSRRQAPLLERLAACAPIDASHTTRTVFVSSSSMSSWERIRRPRRGMMCAPLRPPHAIHRAPMRSSDGWRGAPRLANAAQDRSTSVTAKQGHASRSAFPTNSRAHPAKPRDDHIASLPPNSTPARVSTTQR